MNDLNRNPFESSLLTTNQLQSVDRNFLPIQIISVALMNGLFIAGLLMYFVLQPKLVWMIDPMTMVGLAFAAFGMVASLFAPPLVANKSAEQLSTEIGSIPARDLDRSQLTKLFVPVTTSNVIRYALLEGAGFANLLLGLFVSKSNYNLCAVGVIFLMMIFSFPTKSRLISALEQAYASAAGKYV